MTVTQTLLVFLGIPLLVVLFVLSAVYGRSVVHQPNRYRPGRPWPYPARWFVPHPDALDGAAAVAGRAAIEGTVAEPATPVGGATGEW